MTNRMSIRQKVGEGWRRFLAVIPSFASVLVIFVCTACEAPKVHRDVRLWTDDLAFRISITPTPPVAEEVTVFKIFVQDKETGQPIETGEGRTRIRSTLTMDWRKGRRLGPITLASVSRSPATGP
jgi:hypothetical protein